jgi:seryl-tRNA synthetase
VNAKEKGVQTIGVDTLSKHVEQRDRKIVELEKNQKVLKKQSEKCAKLDKDLTETKSIVLRQSKELESLKVHKKRIKEQNERIEELTRKLEDSDRNMAEEKKISKSLKTQQNDSNSIIRELRNQLANIPSISSPSPSISSEDYDIVLGENRSLKVRVPVIGTYDFSDTLGHYIT